MQAGRIELVTGGTGTSQFQGELFAAPDSEAGAEPVLMALNAEFYELIWRGQKTHEFRRRFLEGRPVRWFVYLNAPVSRLAAVIDLGPAIVDVPERIAAIAEAARPGNGASVLKYVSDLDQAFAVPILHVAEYPGLPAADLRAELGSFHPPQGYVRLAQHPQMLAVCEKVAAGTPVRQLRVHPR
jgi:predicted transcriptional regulator